MTARNWANASDVVIVMEPGSTAASRSRRTSDTGPTRAGLSATTTSNATGPTTEAQPEQSDAGPGNQGDREDRLADNCQFCSSAARTTYPFRKAEYSEGSRIRRRLGPGRLIAPVSPVPMNPSYETPRRDRRSTLRKLRFVRRGGPKSTDPLDSVQGSQLVIALLSTPASGSARTTIDRVPAASIVPRPAAEPFCPSAVMPTATHIPATRRAIRNSNSLGPDHRPHLLQQGRYRRTAVQGVSWITSSHTPTTFGS